MSFSVTTPLATGPRSRTLLDIFNAPAVRCGDRLAIDATDAALTYNQRTRAAEKLANRLGSRTGSAPVERVRSRVRGLMSRAV